MDEQVSNFGFLKRGKNHLSQLKKETKYQRGEIKMNRSKEKYTANNIIIMLKSDTQKSNVIFIITLQP